MTATSRSILEPPAGYRSPEVASFVVQLDDQLRRLRDATRELTPDDLAWQSAPGMNSIGMLLAHLAIVEVYWMDLAVARVAEPDVRPVLGIGPDDDGMPLAPDAAPIALLAGKDIAFYQALLEKAREHLKALAKDQPVEALENEIVRPRSDGSPWSCSVRWVYYHVLEHFAGHFGQILLLRHMRRAAPRP